MPSRAVLRSPLRKAMTGLCLIIAAGLVLGQGRGQCGSSVCPVRRSVERIRRSTPDITIPEVVEGARGASSRPL